MSAGVESLRAGWIESALASIGLATIVTDARNHIMSMNPVAESLTGWLLGEAAGTARAERRLGVLGMRERLSLVGGELAIDSGSGRGTTVIARVPLPTGDGGARDG